MMNIEKYFSNKEVSVIDATVKQAELFLLELGSFYPFGTILTNLEEIKPVSGYLGVDRPEHNDMIDFLHKVFEEKVKTGTCSFAVICVDVIVNQTVHNQVIKKDAIELKVLNKNMKWKNYFIPYVLTNDRFITFSEIGTLS